MPRIIGLSATLTALCSSTLELGIDIGSVRAVGQVGVPWSVSSMVQRLGRSGRKDGEPRIMRMFVIESLPKPGDSITDNLYPYLLKAIALTELMIEKWLEPVDLNRVHLSTCIHQIMSCLRQTGGKRAADLYEILCRKGAFRNIPQERFMQLLRSIAAKDVIEQMPEGDLILGLKGEKITGFWDFYSAFQTQREYSVKHGSNEIAVIPADQIPPIKHQIILAGKWWRVMDIDHDMSLVLVSPDVKGKAPIFPGDGGNMHTKVFEKIKQILASEKLYPYLDPQGKSLLDKARNTARQTDILQTGIAHQGNSIHWFPWVGDTARRTLELFALTKGIACSTDALSLRFDSISMDDFHRYLDFVLKTDTKMESLATRMEEKYLDKYDMLIEEELLDWANGQDKLDFLTARQAAFDTQRAIS